MDFFTPPMLDLRPRASLLPRDGYSLTDHMCHACGSRVCEHADGWFICATCEYRATTHKGLCMCGLIVGGKRGRYRCAVNPRQHSADTARIIPMFDGRRAYPVGERREPVVHSLVGTGVSKNIARAKLRKRPVGYAQRLIAPPPIVVDTARYDPEPVQWWATPPA
jgi:hypothetical protein